MEALTPNEEPDTNSGCRNDGCFWIIALCIGAATVTNIVKLVLDHAC